MRRQHRFRWEGWFASLPVAPASRQDDAATVKYGGTWATSTTASAYGGTLRYTSTAGRTASTTVTCSSIAWVTTLGANRGKAEVRVDGVRVATVSLYASTTTARTIAWSARPATAGSHTVTIKVLGSHATGATGSRVDFDAFLVLGS